MAFCVVCDSRHICHSVWRDDSGFGSNTGVLIAVNLRYLILMRRVSECITVI